MPESRNVFLVITRKEAFFTQTIEHFKEHFPPRTEFKRCFVEEAVKSFETYKPFIVLIDLGNPVLPSDVLMSSLKTILSSSAEIHVICAAEPHDASLVLKLVRLGVRDFLAFPFVKEEVRKTSEEIYSTTLAGTNPAASKIVTLYSPKGGTGVTLIAANLAIALKDKKDKSVVLLDLSNQCGDVVTYLNVTPQYTFRDVIDNHSLLDPSFIDGVLVKHESGIRIMACPRQSQEEPDASHLNILRSVISILKASFDYILVDGSNLDTVLLQYLMSDSSIIFLIANPDVVSLKGVVTFFNQLKSLHFDPQKIKVIINRYNSKNQIDVREFEKLTKHQIAGYLPNNYSVCIDAVNQGVPLKFINDKSDLVRKLAELADMVDQPIASTGTSETKLHGIDVLYKKP